MNTVTFPGLNLEFNISRIAFKIFGVEVYWYAILIVTSIVIALIIFKKRDGLYGVKFNNILDLCLYVIPISIISARLYYLIFNMEYYLQNPKQILNFRSGGLAIYGAVIGGLITCFIFCKKREINIFDLLDYIVPGLALGQAIGRWGNFINIEAYGIQTKSLFRMGITEAGKYIEVHPTFLYESIACFVIFIILLVMKKKRTFKGQILFIYLLLYSLERFFVEGLRIDSLMIGNIKVSQILSVVIFVNCLTIYIIKSCKSKKKM